MASGYAYPSDLARYVEAHWPSTSPLTVPSDVLAEALSAVFHASLTHEESRPTRFRLLLTPATRLPENGAPNEGVLRLTFDRSRPLHADELRRLAPAVSFETSLIGAHVEEGAALRIWGIAHSGPAWLAPTWGGRSLVPNWTYDPIIHATAPGQLAVRCAGKLVGAIVRGVIVDALMDVFDSEWLPAMFEREREEVRTQHAALQAQAVSPTTVEHSLIGRVSQHMLRRAIRLVLGTRHGGMILIVDEGVDSSNRATSRTGLGVKYGINQDEPAHRYRTLLFQVLEAVAVAASKTSVGWSDFVSSASADLERLEQAVFEWSRVVANLAAVDGAVVLDRRFGLIGFGAEVSGRLHAPPRVWRALDTEGKMRRAEDVESVGTRHRAAYRFVNEHPGALAIVISTDGGVSFVANREQEVVIWEQSMSP